ncbi:MAG: polysaccharide deacetylase family protein [Candidatus Acidiferrum sp.]|jgi:peptidoglycan/xylan/chitin deacetylase (PgdA/CDA1 family)
MNPWLIAPPALLTGAAAMIAYGAAHPRSQLFGPVISHTDAARKLALTFDDGPNPAVTPKLLELLARHNARATFFLVGKFVRQCPDLVKELAARGHNIGNHTESHPNLFFCGPQETREELQRCTDAIEQLLWAKPRWFRPPFGFRSPWLGDILHQHGMTNVTWSLIPGDWRSKPAGWLIERMKPIAANVQAHLPKAKAGGATSGDILCLHDGDHARLNGDRERTFKALEFWLPRWRDLGLEFVTMDEIMRKAVEA